jgi:hypothetical protein
LMGLAIGIQKRQGTSFDRTRREAETRLRIPGARLSFQWFAFFMRRFVKAKQIRVSNLPSSYVWGMNQASF